MEVETYLVIIGRLKLADSTELTPTFTLRDDVGCLLNGLFRTIRKCVSGNGRFPKIRG